MGSRPLQFCWFFVYRKRWGCLHAAVCRRDGGGLSVDEAWSRRPRGLVTGPHPVDYVYSRLVGDPRVGRTGVVMSRDRTTSEYWTSQVVGVVEVRVFGRTVWSTSASTTTGVTVETP